LDDSARKVLDLADSERQKMSQMHVGAGHLLAGALGSGSPAATILAIRGVLSRTFVPDARVE
jgi:hypothetical protein